VIPSFGGPRLPAVGGAKGDRGSVVAESPNGRDGARPSGHGRPGRAGRLQQTADQEDATEMEMIEC